MATTAKKPVVKKEEKIVKSKKEVGLTINVLDLKGKKVGTMTLPGEIFGVQENTALLAQAIRVARANKRQGTQSTKTRSEVAGSTRKVYKQKGTGRARHGDIKAPIYIGGGIAHGPKPRDYSLELPKKMRRKALFMALSLTLKNQSLAVITGLKTIKPKTKEMAQVLSALRGEDKKKAGRVLIVTGENEENIIKAGRNIEGVSLTQANRLNTYDILNSPKIIMMKEAVGEIEKTYLQTKVN